MIVDFYIRCQKKGGGRWVHRTEIGLFSSYQQQHILQNIYRCRKRKTSDCQVVRECPEQTEEEEDVAGWGWAELRLNFNLQHLLLLCRSISRRVWTRTKWWYQGCARSKTGGSGPGCSWEEATSSGAKPERNALNKQKKKNTWEVEVEQKHQQDPVAGASAEASAWTSLQSSRSNSKWSWTREGCIPGTAGSRLDQKLLWAEASLRSFWSSLPSVPWHLVPLPGSTGSTGSMMIIWGRAIMGQSRPVGVLLTSLNINGEKMIWFHWFL